jgi:chromosome segregation ATPase
MAIMQDILSKEAASRVQLEDRVQTAQEETTRLRQQLAEVQAQLSSTRVSEATLSSELRAAEKTIVEERQAFDRRESQFEQVLGGIQQANDQYADIARHAHSVMLETIFAITQASESVERRGDLVFETYFVENSSTVLDSKSNTPQKEVMSKDGLQSIVAEVE